MNNKIYLVKTTPSGSRYYATRANMQGIPRDQIAANHISVHGGIPHVTLERGAARRGLKSGDIWMTPGGVPVTLIQQQKYNNLKGRYESAFLKINQHPNNYQNLAELMPPPGGGGGLFSFGGSPPPSPTWSLKKGGKIPKSGLYKLHKGEVVVPAHRVKTVDKALKKSKRKPLKKVCKNCKIKY
jgi:hypothetical protein